MKSIFYIKEIEPRYFEIDGTAGKFQFYGYSREDAIRLYQEEVHNKVRTRRKNNGKNQSKSNTH